jgi:hypothetical protein
MMRLRISDNMIDRTRAEVLRASARLGRFVFGIAVD